MSDPVRLGSDDVFRTLQEAAKRFGDGKRLPVDSTGRLRHCGRCERLRAEFERYDPSWSPAICHSSISNGRRYWAGTCKPCGEIEGAERAAAKANATSSVVRPAVAVARTEPVQRKLSDYLSDPAEDP